MAYYRLYFLDALGHIRQFREFEAITDAAAARQSEEWRDLRAMELWSGRRKVKNWDSLGLSPEARARSAVRAVQLAG